MEVLKQILSEFIFQIIKKLDFSKLYEIRMRNSQPITINYNNNYYYISEKGLTNNKEEAVVSSENDIKQVILNATNSSIYAVNDQLKQGFVSCLGGVRIGVVGQVVDENGQIITVKDYSSINIRIPHEVKGCSLNVLPYLFDKKEFLNTLVVSQPGAGKTTFLRDVCFQLSNHNMPFNILLLDERNEIASCYNGKSLLDVGNFTDVISGGNKLFGFTNGIRSMSPDIICTDELGNKLDYDAVEYANTCGVKLIASVHSSSVFELKHKQNFKDIINDRIFKRYVFLSNNNGKGTIDNVFDENFRVIYSRV